jgi:hypothetical protein
MQVQRDVSSLGWFEQLRMRMEQPIEIETKIKPPPTRYSGSWTVIRVYICSTIDDTQVLINHCYCMYTE